MSGFSNCTNAPVSVEISLAFVERLSRFIPPARNPSLNLMRSAAGSRDVGGISYAARMMRKGREPRDCRWLFRNSMSEVRCPTLEQRFPHVGFRRHDLHERVI